MDEGGGAGAAAAAAGNAAGAAAVHHNARSAEDVFRDFRARRAGIVKALTTDVEKFYRQCDPEKENLCLYGLPNETWDVTLPAEEVPPELPEPALGINFARDGMIEKDWLSLVAVHSDAWLLSVAFYFGARFGFDKEARRRLFTMINGLPTVYEVVTGIAKKQTKVSNGSSKSNKSNPKPSKQSNSNSKPAKPPQPKDEEDSGPEGAEDEDQAYMCGACGETYANGEFWICCDVCEKWFHGKCVRITPAKAEHIKQYKCPGCSSKRSRE
ncbi:PHD finger protein ALFIN-LIKE 7 [Oryza glaberrima]|uniref:PHD finger protein ALFIN-LIKE n=3 Tax=Oryza TaxID=4527 RepID=A0A0D3F6I7_9ORYZ|nr:PHD finger protein ALFIN-LIKE 7 [Oryza glaberrima]